VWLTSILVDQSVTGWQPQDLAAELAKSDIESRPLWKPMHLQPVFSGSRGIINGVSESLFARGLTLPSGSALSAEQRERVRSAILAFLDGR
jgi:dTDP-4-amino-4,6-dideoxygalactose transaminase